MSHLTPKPYLQDIAESIERIDEYTYSVEFYEFAAHQKSIDAVERRFEIIGEAAKRIQNKFPNFVAAHPSVPWNKMIGMRNVLAHEYDAIDAERVWKTIREELPLLYRSIAMLLDE